MRNHAAEIAALVFERYNLINLHMASLRLPYVIWEDPEGEMEVPVSNSADVNNNGGEEGVTTGAMNGGHEEVAGVDEIHVVPQLCKEEGDDKDGNQEDTSASQDQTSVPDAPIDAEKATSTVEVQQLATNVARTITILTEEPELELEESAESEIEK